MKRPLNNLLKQNSLSKASGVPKAHASNLLHFVRFKLGRPRVQFEKAMMVFSFDIDVGTKDLGSLNRGENDRCVHDYQSEYHIGEIEEVAILLFLDLFETYKIPVTFAIRGQLTAVDNELLPLILSSPLKHDIGGHGYSHKVFTHLSVQEAESELKMLSYGLKKYGAEPKSFVFPKNQIAHLELLEKFGYECYREIGNFLKDGMYIVKHGGLFDVHPSFYLNERTKAAYLQSLLKIAIKKRTPLHYWSHLWCFGENRRQIQENIERVLMPFVEYAKKQEQDHALEFMTMLSASRKAGRQLVQ